MRARGRVPVRARELGACCWGSRAGKSWVWKREHAHAHMHTHARTRRPATSEGAHPVWGSSGVTTKKAVQLLLLMCKFEVDRLQVCGGGGVMQGVQCKGAA